MPRPSRPSSARRGPSKGRGRGERPTTPRSFHACIGTWSVLRPSSVRSDGSHGSVGNGESRSSLRGREVASTSGSDPGPRVGFVVVDGIDDRVDAYLQRTGLGIASLRLSPTDPHPNRQLHALIGASLYEEAVLPLVLQRINWGGQLSKGAA